MVKYKTMYMRIGFDKAGTTTLASLIDNNQKIFNECNFYAPVRNCLALYNQLVKRYNLHNIDVFDPTRFFNKNPHSLEQYNLFMQQLQEGGIDHNILLSTETFWGRLVRKAVLFENDIANLCEAIIDLFKNFDIKIILHIRRADLYFESKYKQAVKAGKVPCFKNIMKGHEPLNCIKLINILGDMFGSKNIIVRPFERRQMKDEDLISDFLELIGLYNAKDRFKVKTENESLHRDLVETLIPLNNRYGKLLENKELIEISNKLKYVYCLPDAKYILTREARQNIVDRYYELYGTISQIFLGGHPLFRDKASDIQYSNYQLSDERLRFVLGLIAPYTQGAVDLNSCRKWR